LQGKLTKWRKNQKGLGLHPGKRQGNGLSRDKWADPSAFLPISIQGFLDDVGDIWNGHFCTKSTAHFKRRKKKGKLEKEIRKGPEKRKKP